MSLSTTRVRGARVPLANSAPTIVADLTGMRDDLVARGNRMSDTSSVRAAMAPADMDPGLEFFETNTGRTYRVIGGVWRRVDVLSVTITATTNSNGVVVWNHGYGEMPGACVVSIGNGNNENVMRQSEAKVFEVTAALVQIRLANTTNNTWLANTPVVIHATLFPGVPA